MASSENEEGALEGNYINSFVSFLQGSNNSEDNSEEVDENQEEDTTEANKTEMRPKNSKSKKNGNYDDSSNDEDNHIQSKRRKEDATVDASRRSTRRASRGVKTPLLTHNTDDEEQAVDDPSDEDFVLSDSDDDPDFNMGAKKKKSNTEADAPFIRFSRGRGNKRGRFRSAQRSGRVSGADKNDSTASNSLEESGDKPANSDDSSNGNANGGNSTAFRKRRGRPPYKPIVVGAREVPPAQPHIIDTRDTPQQPNQISDDTVSSSSDGANLSSNKISSAYNYAASRIRQNQAIRLPEGPDLTKEQLQMVESQFKNGDFVMAKKDRDVMDNPPIWRIDGKSLLQKFQAFTKDDKIFYRNVSTYSGWTPQAKVLYVPVKTKFVFQSRYDTVVELLGAADEATNGNAVKIDIPPVLNTVTNDVDISEMLSAHMADFEIFIQSLISQALDSNFLQEIYEENDEYFVDKIKLIEGLAEARKSAVLSFAKWNGEFQASLDTWPSLNSMVSQTRKQCEACGRDESRSLSQLYGDPYDPVTLKPREPATASLDNKNFETCESCTALSQLYNKVAHQKYDLFLKCRATVTNVRSTYPNKNTTNVLRDLLANDDWIASLFRPMCTTLAKVDAALLDRQKDDAAPSERDASPPPRATT